MKHLKQSTNFCSRRAFRHISSRQRQRIAAELKRSRVESSNNLLRSHHNITLELRDPVDHLVSIDNSVTSEQPGNSSLALPDVVNSECLSENGQSFSDTSTTYVSDGDEDSEGENNVDYTSTFTEKLATCFVKNNINHIQGNMILKTLRSHNCLSYLPKDVRTLLKIPRMSIELRNVSPGEYLHTGFVTDQLGSTIRDEIRGVIKAALAQSVKVPCKPACLPLKTAEDIKKFDSLPNEEYDNVVRYLSHIGGWTARSCANAVLKEAANDEVFHNFTFTGYKEKNVFKDLRFAKACEEAMAANQNFKLTQAVFKEAITEALRSSKQRFRNRQV